MLFVDVFIVHEYAGYLKEFKLKQGETRTYFLNSIYHISSNNSRPSILIALIWWKYLKYLPPSNKRTPPPGPPSPSSLLPVKLKGNLISDDSSSEN